MRSLLALLTALLVFAPATSALAGPLTPVREDGVWVYPMVYGIDYTGELAASSQRTPTGDPVDVWRFDGARGACVQVHVQSSDLQPTVQLAQTTPNGTVVTPAASATADALHPTYRLASTEGYFIKITAAPTARQQGQYQLRLDRC
jgi:hypothetical protein